MTFPFRPQQRPLADIRRLAATRPLAAARPLGLVAALALALATPGAADAQGQPGMPPTSVSVLRMTPEPLPVINELPGRISATRISEVRPRVSGILVERVFEQGSLVEQGDVLYRIDPAPFRVRVASAEASVARAEATLQNARVELTRQTQLRDRNISAGVEYDNAATLVAQAEADLSVAQATLAEAQLNLDYTEVRAPISGTIGRALVTEGALVSATGGETLAMIQQLDPVYADVTQSSSELFRLRRALASGEIMSPAPGEASVQLFFDDGTAYEHPGSLLFSEAAVDEATGQITLRGEFPNPDGNLLPGLYVRVRIEQAVRTDALAIPQQAVLRDNQGNAQVYVVNDDNTAEMRQLRLGQTIGARWLVESGLEPGERVVVAGAQKLWPGAPVAPEEVTPDTAAAAGDEL